jgi:hypothetical protein
VLKVERDLESFPFDLEREVETVDDRHSGTPVPFQPKPARTIVSENWKKKV